MLDLPNEHMDHPVLLMKHQYCATKCIWWNVIDVIFSLFLSRSLKHMLSCLEKRSPVSSCLVPTARNGCTSPWRPTTTNPMRPPPRPPQLPPQLPPFQGPPRSLPSLTSACQSQPPTWTIWEANGGPHLHLAPRPHHHYHHRHHHHKPPQTPRPITTRPLRLCIATTRPQIER